MEPRSAATAGRTALSRRVSCCLSIGLLAALLPLAACASAQAGAAASPTSSGRLEGNGPTLNVTVFNDTPRLAAARVLCGGQPIRIKRRLPTTTEWHVRLPTVACGTNIEVQADVAHGSYTTGPITVGSSGSVYVTINKGTPKLSYQVSH